MQLLEMVERNEINRSLLALLDENIADAHRGNQVKQIGMLFLLVSIIHVIGIFMHIP